MSDIYLRNMKDVSGGDGRSAFFKVVFTKVDTLVLMISFIINLNLNVELKFSHFIVKLRIYCLFAILREIPTNQLAFLMFAHLFERNKQHAIQNIAYVQKPSL